jgi:gentisate 1,2-dioxygenase
MGNMNAAGFVAARNIEELHALLAASGMGPGWNKPEPSLWPAPKSAFVPAHWSYALAKPALDAAGRFVSTELAERRNLILFNPIPGNHYATARTLIASYQMVLPGEIARTHRHTPNALRLVLDTAEHAYTVVDGKKIPMLAGDVLLTRNWSWHGHRNEGDASAYWIDFLDVPLVHFLEPMFYEPFPGGAEENAALDARSPMRFPIAAIREKLEVQSETRPGVREVTLGPPQIDTIALAVVRLDARAAYAPKRSTVNAIFAVIEGHGSVSFDDRELEWRRGDVFVAPAWRAYECRAFERSLLFRVSDEPVLRKLGWFRDST